MRIDFASHQYQENISNSQVKAGGLGNRILLCGMTKPIASKTGPSAVRSGVQITVVKNAWCVIPLAYKPEKKSYVRRGKPIFIIRSKSRAGETLLAKILDALENGGFDQTKDY